MAKPGLLLLSYVALYSFDDIRKTQDVIDTSTPEPPSSKPQNCDILSKTSTFQLEDPGIGIIHKATQESLKVRDVPPPDV